MLLRRGSKRRAGFTLIEMAVVMAIGAIIAAIAVPPWRQYRARMEAYSAAQELRAELVNLQTVSIDKESPVLLRIDSATQYSVYLVPKATVNSATAPYRRVRLEGGTQLSPATGDLVFGERGWVATGTNGTTLTSATVGGFTVYTLTVSSPGVVNVPVNIHVNGKVQVQ